MTTVKKRGIVNSALWAAYGDALGFITELADEKMVSRRTGLTRVVELVDWKRKVGGMYGPLVSLPKGTYSDDTQLRLATSRSINCDYYFSINAFSKVELPVWSVYALGAGIGSKIAASDLAKRNVAWFSNFYDGKSQYINSGGNGAVMRIQPHVWACHSPENPELFISDVIKNSLTTHGHPRAIAGSVFHALTLAYVISKEKLPNIESAKIFNQWTKEIPRIIRQDINLSTAWVPLFENQFGKSLDEAYEDVHREIAELIQIVSKWKSSNSPCYQTLVEALDLKNEKIRGSGTLTAVAALAASTIEEDLTSLMVTMVNALGTDTDSIATMVGAIRGVLDDSMPPQDVQDQTYIIQDAERLYRISNNNEKNNYLYPDTMSWRVPSSTLDYVASYKGELVFPPFGVVVQKSEAFSSNNTESYDYHYQWVSSSFGQSFLVKIRNSQSIREIDNHQALDVVEPAQKKDQVRSQIEIDLPVEQSTDDTSVRSKEIVDLDELTSIAIANNFDPTTLGNHLIRVSHSELGVNGAIAYSAIISKALSARNKRNKQ
ncbi:ADP-ribosylglycohydrolase family protein [Vibrio fluvialis]|nr:ADP-ribosylglycohydrolase family protein [Vibrio fluvialis]EKO3523791.1 ADP-ribosylglycohydrolase family protein [Vibrio fluvialis]EKO3528184.1 ADP-ribosylglycohydrolase family protein [Vibrio fluvialis]EKO3532467.1 ADP-ribosylglycohydrolase family protein [Vibrio fluvialis]EKO3546511.1 ADP-ribosylglycohydrolase family protein [Vibrio fluvialis]